ncbi:MAG TPA: hypothetical protein VI636_20025 [Candidatus Angelobacter sp.]
MKKFARAISFSVCMMFLLISVNSIAQNPPQKPSKLPVLNPGYVRMPKVNINSVQPTSSTIRLVLPKGVTSTRGVFVNDANSPGGGLRNNAAHSSGSGNNASIRGLDTVPTFTGAFNSTAPSIDFFQSSDGVTTTSPFIMIGNNPLLGDTTVIPANLSTVSLQLLNPDGSVFANVPFAPFEDLLEDSPNFRNAHYSVGNTQFGDAVQRAEFFNMMDEDWHTLLNPHIANRATIQVPATVQVVFFDGTVLTVPGYIPSTAPDGTTVVFMLDLLFSALDFNQAVNDINSGAFATNAMNYHVYPNTFLFSVVDEAGDLACCTLGFHEYIFDPTVTPEKRWIYSFASWMSPGVFGGGAQDVTAFSHETSEALNDPFGNNIVPTWQFPGIFGACQANLETGDPVEVLPNETVPIVTRERNEVFQYHPQTEALLQWFEIGNPSNAIGGAFSYPDTTALPTAATPCPF